MHNNTQSAQLKAVPQLRNGGNNLRTRSLHFDGTCKIGQLCGSVVVAVWWHLDYARSYWRHVEAEKDCPYVLVLI